MKGDIVDGTVRLTQVVLEASTTGKRTSFETPIRGGVFFIVRVGIASPGFNTKATLVVDNAMVASARVSGDSPQLSGFTESEHPRFDFSRPIKVSALSGFEVMFHDEPPSGSIARVQGFMSHHAFEE